MPLPPTYEAGCGRARGGDDSCLKYYIVNFRPWALGLTLFQAFPFMANGSTTADSARRPAPTCFAWSASRINPRRWSGTIRSEPTCPPTSGVSRSGGTGPRCQRITVRALVSRLRVSVGRRSRIMVYTSNEFERDFLFEVTEVPTGTAV